MLDFKDLPITANDGPAGLLQSGSKGNIRTDLCFESTLTDIILDEDERSRARQLLTPEEEKKLLRRIDWHLMPLCSIIFMFKNLDSDNVSLAIEMGSVESPVLTDPNSKGIKRSHHEPRYRSEHHDPTGNEF